MTSGSGVPGWSVASRCGRIDLITSLCRRLRRMIRRAGSLVQPVPLLQQRPRMTDVVLLPAVRQVEMLGAHEVSVVELAEAHVRQIERLNPRLNAFADFDAERVRVQARAMDAVPTDARGPLHGLPVTVKSSIATTGYKCAIGSQ